ncbi:MAG: tetratricopeptide repeat protein [Caulobacteraceae bacterium]|nr:tetratricopeptide repeat protein [Caulobacteraceae bacterium]
MSKASRLLLLSAALLAPLAGLALSGCAADPARAPLAAIPSAGAAIQEDDSPSSNYGLFLAGEAALHGGRPEDAARYFARAAQGAGDQAAADQDLIREKAFEAAVMAGDIDRASGLVPADPAGPAPAQRLARLVRAVDALSEGRNKEANAILTAPGGGAAFNGGITLLRPWAAAAAGDLQGAVTQPGAPAPRLTRLSAQESQAMLYERAKRYDEAETDYKALTGNPQLGGLYVLSHGAFLERRGRAKEAVALYTDALQRSPNDRDLKRALARAGAAKRPPAMLTLKQGAAKAMTAAAELALVDKQINEGDIYLRLALRLDPQRDEAWVLLGDIRAASDQQQAARDAYGHIGPSSPNWPEARQRVIASYQAEGDNETALRLVSDLIKVEPSDRDALIAQADILRATDRFEEAVKVLDKLISDNSGGPAGWALYFERGTALDRAGRWADAEKDLLKALTLQPDEPDVLNYLGYSWIVRGERTQQALGMLQRAYLAQPDSGEIADSLGWAYYNMGDFKQAVQRLERAVSLSPVSAEITDHLGDAYWRAGRKTEAQYQWTRVLTLAPTPELKTAAERKITSGLTPAVAASTRS